MRYITIALKCSSKAKCDKWVEKKAHTVMHTSKEGNKQFERLIWIEKKKQQI